MCPSIWKVFFEFPTCWSWNTHFVGVFLLMMIIDRATKCASRHRHQQRFLPEQKDLNMMMRANGVQREMELVSEHIRKHMNKKLIAQL